MSDHKSPSVRHRRVRSNLRPFVLSRDGYRCSTCGRRRSRADLTVHHIVPVAEGGQTTMSNLTTVCRDCHIEHHRQLDMQRMRTEVL